MGEVTYSISQAAKLVGVETYVLRFWEEELLLDIGRNEKGYRFYTNEDIRLMQKIKEWKKTYALKDIREMIGKKDKKQEQFLMIMERLVEQVMKERKSPENRFKKIDKAIRRHQMERKMVAAAIDRKDIKDTAKKKNKKIADLLKPKKQKVQKSIK